MSNLLTADSREIFQTSSKPSLIITAGNSFRNDDGVGPYIASQIKSFKGVQVMDAGNTPENIIDEVIELHPVHIIIIDAADFSGTPGETRLIPEENVSETSLSTHRIPMTVISKLIQDSIDCKTTFVGIQPKTVTMGEGLSSEVKTSADEIVRVIKENNN